MNRQNIKPSALLYLVVLVFAAQLAGCVSGGSTPSRPVEKFMFFYQPPVASSEKTSSYAVAVERFSGAQILRTGAMVYIPEPYRIDSYQFHRWQMPPGEMVSEFILRDLRNSGLFKAVFGPGDPAPVKLRVFGRVEECQESDVDGKVHAVLSFQATVIDDGNRGEGRQILFQKFYRHAEPMNSKTPVSMAEAMSRAMKILSGQIVRDVSEISKAEVKK